MTDSSKHIFINGIQCRQIGFSDVLQKEDKVYGLKRSGNNQIANLVELEAGEDSGDFVPTSDFNLFKKESEGALAELTAKTNDIDVIRANAELGSTALQKVPDNYVTSDALQVSLNDVMHKSTAETVPGVKTFTGGTSGTLEKPSIISANSIHVGSASTTNYTGIFNHRKCSDDEKYVNTAGFLVNSDGTVKFTHRRGTLSAPATTDDAYILLSKTKLLYYDGTSHNILHDGNAYTKDVIDSKLASSGMTGTALKVTTLATNAELATAVQKINEIIARLQDRGITTA